MRLLLLTLVVVASNASAAYPIATYTASLDSGPVLNCLVLSDGTGEKFVRSEGQTDAQMSHEVFTPAEKDFKKLGQLVRYFNESTSVGLGRFSNLSPYTRAVLDSGGPLIGVVYLGRENADPALRPEVDFLEVIQGNSVARLLESVCGFN